MIPVAVPSLRLAPRVVDSFAAVLHSLTVAVVVAVVGVVVVDRLVPSPAPAAVFVDLDDEARIADTAGQEVIAAFAVDSAATVTVSASSPASSWECQNDSATNVFRVNEGAASTTNGIGPYCSTCGAGARFVLPAQKVFLRTSAGSATVQCSRLALGQHVSSGGGLGAADGTYLRLDASNDPLTGELAGVSGTAAAPAFTFVGDTNTGLFAVAADNVSVATGGSERVRFSTTAMSNQSVTGSFNLLYAAGTAAAPTFAFSGDTDTGLFRAAANVPAISAGGTEMLRFDTQQAQGISTGGSSAAPFWTFAGDNNTGMYRVGADQLGFTVGANGGFTLGVTRNLSLDMIDDSTGNAGVTRSAIRLGGSYGADGDAVTGGTCTLADQGITVFVGDTNDAKGDRICICIGDATDTATWLVIDVDAVTPVFKKSATCASGS